MRQKAQDIVRSGGILPQANLDANCAHSPSTVDVAALHIKYWIAFKAISNYRGFPSMLFPFVMPANLLQFPVSRLIEGVHNRFIKIP